MTKSMVVAAGLLLVAVPAVAQEGCGSVEELAEILEQEYGEVPTVGGLNGKGRLLQVYTSEWGSWTLVMEDPSGVACIMDAGKHWMVRKVKKGERS